jgi:D-sedoheptulose 7-phosphate isomerase
MDTRLASGAYARADMQLRAVDPYAGAKYDLIVRQLARQGKLRILNAGCGSGELSCLLARHGHRVLGIDPVADYIEAAQDAARTANLPHCQFEVGAIETLPLDTVFDAVVAADDLERNVSANLVHALRYARDVGTTILAIVGRVEGFASRAADCCVVIPSVNPATLTPHTEAFQAVVWHLLVSHPALRATEMKWESLG